MIQLNVLNRIQYLSNRRLEEGTEQTAVELPSAKTVLFFTRVAAFNLPNRFSVQKNRIAPLSRGGGGPRETLLTAFSAAKQYSTSALSSNNVLLVVFT
jgi:hypothetical protein